MPTTPNVDTAVLVARQRGRSPILHLSELRLFKRPGRGSSFNGGGLRGRADGPGRTSRR